MSRYIPDIDLEDYFSPEQLSKYRDLFDITVGRSNGTLSEAQLPELLQRVKAKTEDLKEYEIPSEGVDFTQFLDLLVKVNKLKIRADLIDYRKYLNSGKIAQFRQLFTQVGGGAEGLNRDQLAALFARLGLNLNEKMLSEIISEVDKDGSGSIEFEEFASMLAKITNSKKKVIPREYLTSPEISEYREAFKFFCNEAEVISGSDLDRLFRKMGFNLKKDQVDALLREFDEDCSGQIEIAEFCVMMIKLRKQKRFRRISRSPLAGPVADLVTEGLTAEELKELEYHVSELKPFFSSKDLLEAGFEIADLIAGDITVAELGEAGLGVSGLRQAGVSSLVLRQAGFSAEAIRKANRALAVAKWELENFPDDADAGSPTKGAKGAVAPAGGAAGLSAREAKLRELTRLNQGGVPQLTPRLRSN